MISRNVVRFHGPVHHRAVLERAFWLRVEPDIESFRKMVCITVTDFENPTVPHRMEIPRFMPVRIDGLADELYLRIISTMVRIVASMKRLVQVADKVDEILEGFLPFLEVGSGITKDFSKAFDLPDHTLILGAVAGCVVLGLGDVNVHIMPRCGLLVPHLVCPTSRFNECGSFQEGIHRISHLRVKSLFGEYGNDLMPFPCPGIER